MTLGLPKALLFDLDGTLIDSIEDIAHALNAALADQGLPTHDVDAVRGFVGEGICVLVQRAMTAGGDFDTLLADVRERYAQNCTVHTRPYPGIVEMLGRLREHELPMAVLSNKPHDIAKRVVSTLFADVPFAVVLGERPGSARKPDPQGAITIAQSLGIEPRRCWLVGDTTVDLQTAAGAGMVGVAVAWGFRTADELRARSPTHIFATPAELASQALGS